MGKGLIDLLNFRSSGKLNAGGGGVSPADGLASYPGEVRVLLVVSCYEPEKCSPDGPLGSACPYLLLALV